MSIPSRIGVSFYFSWFIFVFALAGEIKWHPSELWWTGGDLELLLEELSVYESKTVDFMSSCEVWYEPLQGGSMGDSS